MLLVLVMLFAKGSEEKLLQTFRESFVERISITLFGASQKMFGGGWDFFYYVQGENWAIFHKRKSSIL